MMPWSESLCGQYAFNSGLRVLAMLPCCNVWGVDGGVRCKLHSVGRVERVGHALLLCWCVIAILAVRLVIPHEVAASLMLRSVFLLCLCHACVIDYVAAPASRH